METSLSPAADRSHPISRLRNAAGVRYVGLPARRGAQQNEGRTTPRCWACLVCPAEIRPGSDPHRFPPPEDGGGDESHEQADREWFQEGHRRVDERIVEQPFQ